MFFGFFVGVVVGWVVFKRPDLIEKWVAQATAKFSSD